MLRAIPHAWQPGHQYVARAPSTVRRVRDVHLLFGRHDLVHALEILPGFGQDIVPLIDENRALVRRLMEQLRQQSRQQNGDSSDQSRDGGGEQRASPAAHVQDPRGTGLDRRGALDEQQQRVEHFVTEGHDLVVAPKLTLPARLDWVAS